MDLIGGLRPDMSDTRPSPVALHGAARVSCLQIKHHTILHNTIFMKALRQILLLLCTLVGGSTLLQAQTPNITLVPYLSGYAGTVTGWGVTQGDKVYPNAQHKVFRIGQLGHLIVPNANATVQMVVNTWEVSNGFRTQAFNLFQEGINDPTPGNTVIILRCDKVTPCSAGPGATCTVQHLPPTGVLGCAGQCCADPGPLLVDFIGDAIIL